MKILVLSDSHGRVDLMICAVEEEKPDRVFFLGDNYRDGKELAAAYPGLPMDLVRGNCDWGPGPDERLVEVEGVRFLLVHGHLHYAKSRLDRLAQAGAAQGADVVCFGHTHRGLNEPGEGGVWLFNPGSAGGIHARVSYGVITVENGRFRGELR